MLDVAFNKKHVAGTVSVLAAAVLAIVWRYGLGMESAELAAFACVLAVAALVDLESFIIPNGCILAAALIRLCYIGWTALAGAGDAGGMLVSSAATALAVLALLLAIVWVAERLLGRQGIGGGDVKLFAVCALYFSFERTLFLVILACVFGLVLAFARSLRAGDSARAAMDRAFPLGPSIALAACACMLV